MTKRPVYIPSLEKDKYVEIKEIEFKWFSGFAVSQKQKSIASLHESIKKEISVNKILEISTKSIQRFGVAASAFNLKVSFKNIKASVENIYQGSKVFEDGGPYTDLYFKTSVDAKKDIRLKNSGSLTHFEFQDETWTLEEDFYSWIYINGLLQNIVVKNEIIKFDAFTDIEFNPKKSFNCQAKSAAILSSCLIKKMDINKLLITREFKNIFKKNYNLNRQLDMF